MIPLRDSTRSRGLPWVTGALVGLCAAVFALELSADSLDQLVYEHALIPARLLGLVDRIGPFHLEVLWPLLSSMFLHDPGGYACHFFGNVLFLWIFGTAVEARLGAPAYLGLYLAAGIAAAIAQIAAEPASTTPTIGASGAIAGLMGAYLVMTPHIVPALMYLGLWLAMQLLHSGPDGGTAWWAHVGGFAFGALVMLALGRGGRLVRRWLLVPCALLALLALYAAAQEAADGAAEPAAMRGFDPGALEATHLKDGRFFNPWERMQFSTWKAMRWWLFDDNPFDKRREPRVPRLHNRGAYLADSDEPPSLTWVGHAALALHEGGDVLLTDPHFSERALLPRRLHPPGIPLQAIPAHAFAVVSHTHYDHLDERSVRELPETVTWFVPLGVGRFLRAWGRERVVELDWWQSARHGDWTLTCVPSQHWSMRLGQGRNETLWCAWLIDSGRNRYFFAGDTGWFGGFEEYGRRFAPIDVAILPIGAYEPRWFMRYQHMNPDEAYQAFRALGARFMIPMHWGTFDLTDEPLDLPPRALDQAIRARGGELARVKVLAVGERWKLPPRIDDPDEGERELAAR